MKKNKTYCYFASVIAAFSLILITGGWAENQARGKFLVFGFDSTLINNTHSRILREKILWDLHDNGHSIVPVMEFEKAFSVIGEDALRKLSIDKIKKYTISLNADYGISGKIYPDSSGRVQKEIKKGLAYRCEISFFIKKEDRFEKLNIITEGREDYFQYFNELSKIIIEEIEKIIKK